jgi:hypothetical protein
VGEREFGQREGGGGAEGIWQIWRKNWFAFPLCLFPKKQGEGKGHGTGFGISFKGKETNHSSPSPPQPTILLIANVKEKMKRDQCSNYQMKKGQNGNEQNWMKIRIYFGKTKQNGKLKRETIIWEIGWNNM